jgi:ABC-type transport system involved in cytochrome c biogenesis permease subunit
MRVLFALLLLASWFSPGFASDLDRLPVLNQGRVKPFAVAAEESLLAIAGTSHLPDAKSPSEALFALLADPAAWSDKPLVYVPWLELRAELGLAAGEQRASLHQVEKLRPKLEAVSARKRRSEQSGVIEAWSADDEAANTLANRYAEALEVASGRTIQLVPLAVDAEERAWVLKTLAPRVKEPTRPWHETLHGVLAKPEGQDARLAEADIWLTWEDLVRSPDPLLADAPPRLAKVMALCKELGGLTSLTGEGPSYIIPPLTTELYARQGKASPGLISAELIYVQARPFTLAWVCFILGGFLVAGGLAKRTWVYRLGMGLSIVAITATVAGLTVRTIITGLGAVTNLYETLIYVALIVGVLGLLFARMSGQGIYAVAGGIGAGLCAMVGEAMPPDLGSHIGQLQPVLRSKFWLWIHVKTVVAAYAPLTLGLVLGNLVLWRAWRERRAVTMAESKMLYRCLQWGTVLMAAGTLLGAVWADQAWGRFWGWDPKEVGALMIVLTYLVPLHLRYVGAVGPTGIAGWSVLGYLSVVWSWYGVNFVLGAGLHAYAFGNGGQYYVFPLALAQIALTTWQLIAIKANANPKADPRTEEDEKRSREEPGPAAS